MNSSGPTVDEPERIPEVPLTQIALREEERPQKRKGKEKERPRSGKAKLAGNVSSDAPEAAPKKSRKNTSPAPESDMVRFIRLYADLQSERRAASSNGGQQGINVYTW